GDVEGKRGSEIYAYYEYADSRSSSFNWRKLWIFETDTFSEQYQSSFEFLLGNLPTLLLYFEYTSYVNCLFEKRKQTNEFAYIEKIRLEISFSSLIFSF
uniref:hypothetical protein n=1 Tax=Streptococcus suis TaxID=1307 RepID=UPI001EE72FA8